MILSRQGFIPAPHQTQVRSLEYTSSRPINFPKSNSCSNDCLLYFFNDSGVGQDLGDENRPFIIGLQLIPSLNNDPR
ncbi:hypothetical protein HOLleu_30513 [Holothuria leucospilota]|uniref:Uncharacterized protein n=1 Tax=Holothuria leucospilota TaxID=206669 RepID=A0A9Q1BKN7_HOLLE|nr:hypothetical protein HOLleu_30513 [Holothuria leucospilota]